MEFDLIKVPTHFLPRLYGARLQFDAKRFCKVEMDPKPNGHCPKDREVCQEEAYATCCISKAREQV